MRNLKLYYIDNKYINYLRKFDGKVAFNKVPERPYIGVVYTYGNFHYFAPLSSPKEKHLKINPKAIDIFKIADGELGVVNLNNMIPTPMSCLTEVIPIVTDIKYKRLLENQITYLNDNKQKLLAKVTQFQRISRKGHLPERVKTRCCDFLLLEQKCELYIQDKKRELSKENIEPAVTGKQR